MPRFDLTSKTALITGGAVGLGAEYSHTLAEQGADIAIFDFNGEELNSTVADVTRATGKRCKGYTCDVRNYDQVRERVAEVIRDFGKIDILINNAGILNYGSIEEYSVKQWHDAIETDLTSVWFITKEVVLQCMRDRHYGKVVNVASIAGILGTPAGCLSYHAAKGGVLGLTRGQAVEYAPYGITVNAVGPGTILDGTMVSRSKVASDPDTHAKGRNPMKRAGHYGEMSGAVIYLASDESSYTNGQCIFVDGGIDITM